MSEEFGEAKFGLSWRVLLPSAIAVTLFVVLAGLIAAVVIGITADPPENPETAATTRPDSNSLRRRSLLIAEPETALTGEGVSTPPDVPAADEHGGFLAGSSRIQPGGPDDEAAKDHACP